MQITQTHKQMVAKAIAEDLKMRQHSDSGYKQANHAQYLQIHTASYSRISKGDIDKVLSEVEWVRIGKKLFVDLTDSGWKTARTKVFDFVTQQLTYCQNALTNAFNCDLVGIGKTHSAEVYAAKNQNVVYIKCSPGITRAELIRMIAECLGMSSIGTIPSVRRRVIMELYRLREPNPIIILDDAGYLNDSCWMEVKGLIDDLKDACSWYIIGDTSLRKKTEKLIAKDKMGWEAIFDRLGQKYQSITHDYGSEAETAVMRKEMAMQILQLNMPDADAQKRKEILSSSGLSLRALRKEIGKHKRLNSNKAA